MLLSFVVRTVIEEKIDLRRTLLAGLCATLALTPFLYSAVGPATTTAYFFPGTIVFPLLYAGLFRRRLKGPGIFRGMAWGLMLFAFGLFFLAPPDLPLTLSGHLVYGLILGRLAEPRRIARVEILQEDLQPPYRQVA